MPVTKEELHDRLITVFENGRVLLEDTRGNGNHYDVTIISEHFLGLTKLQQHRLVYEALGNWVGTEIHALSLNTLTP